MNRSISLNQFKISSKDNQKLIEEVKKNFYEILFPQKSLFEIDLTRPSSELENASTLGETLEFKNNTDFIAVETFTECECNNLNEVTVILTALSLLIIIMLCKNYLFRKLRLA